ncbi:hypothetical protein ACIO3O_36975 [Streptomyces sp. NPDC087440]|uniref:hypothetical protein n=1 Tax=Streptomyces sp. NPDC087440 TaxID=3365790 RepID=UPI0037F3A8D4
MTMPATFPAAAERIAALLPPRRGKAWTVAAAPDLFRHNAPTARLTDGVRGVLVREKAQRLELVAEHPGKYAPSARPHAVIDATGTDPAQAAASVLLRTVLPDLDRATAEALLRMPGGEARDAWHRGNEMTELGFALLDVKADVRVVDALHGQALVWVTEDGGSWALETKGRNHNLTFNYDGPVGGLYAVLPLLLPPVGEHTPADVGSPFTRLLTDRFPQLSPVADDEVQIPGSCSGWIAAQGELASYADEFTPVRAELPAFGTDLVLAAAAHLA